jgi:hypothetical protein
VGVFYLPVSGQAQAALNWRRAFAVEMGVLYGCRQGKINFKIFKEKQQECCETGQKSRKNGSQQRKDITLGTYGTGKTKAYKRQQAHERAEETGGKTGSS